MLLTAIYQRYTDIEIHALTLFYSSKVCCHEAAKQFKGISKTYWINNMKSLPETFAHKCRYISVDRLISCSTSVKKYLRLT